MKPKTDLIGIFAGHKVAANLLMAMMILGGVFALDRLNIQLFPSFELEVINVRVVWSGASAEDVENDITIPLEQLLKNVDNLRKLESETSQGACAISLELEENADLTVALNQVRQRVDEARNLPTNAEKPEVSQVVHYESIAKLIITGTEDIRELRHLANRFERELVAQGIDKVDIQGLPKEDISIQISSATLQKLRMSLDEIAERVGNLSQNIPAGSFGEFENTRELRGIEQRRDESGFANLPIVSDEKNRTPLGAVAKIERRPQSNGVTLNVGGKPAVELTIRRAENGDSFDSARNFQNWLQATRGTLPPNIKLKVYDERWQSIQERIMLLLKNGAGGLVLVVAILYTFLNGRVAWWVAVGIPVSFLATLFFLLLAGASINMISLFALIMTLGIIVDDAIVVGEDAYTHYQSGDTPMRAAEGGARRMLAPVIASSLTTIAAFLPIMLLTGVMGKILFAIPLVVITVILASLFESFLVLPGHLRHSLGTIKSVSQHGVRARIDKAFENFKENRFRRVINYALDNRRLGLCIAVALLIICAGLFSGDRLKFTFFPSPESSVVYANAVFMPGTPKQEILRFLNHLEQTLKQTDAEISPQELVKTVIVRNGTTSAMRQSKDFLDEHVGSLNIELVDSDLRDIRNDTLIEEWRSKIEQPSNLQLLTIGSRQAVPDSGTIAIQLTYLDPEVIKRAALELAESLRAIPGVSNVEDNMPFGREQLIYRLTPVGKSLGLTTSELGRQLRTAFDGRLVQMFQDGPNEVEVRVQLPEEERARLNALDRLEITLGSGRTVPLTTVAEWESRIGFAILRHAEGQLAVEIKANVDSTVNNANRISNALENSTLPELSSRYGVSYSFAGRSADQVETLANLIRGVLLGLVLIYLVLAWVLSSYSRPLVVMSIIPFGLVGAIAGHLWMGIDFTLMSLLGFFGLSGIVVNDSIILVTFFSQLLDKGYLPQDALIEASCLRLRAVLLTSLTTIAGLIPLLFETSSQAQFLIPMATSLAFGLGFSTLLVLLVVPILLSYQMDIVSKYKVWRGGSSIKLDPPKSEIEG